MKLRQKIVSLFAAAVTAVSTLSVTAFATDPVGSGELIELKEGVQATEIIKFTDTKDYDNGHNYVDFTYTAPANGIMTITFDAAINNTDLVVYRDSNKETLKPTSYNVVTGRGSADDNYKYQYDENAGIFSGAVDYEVEKGDYIIRVSRSFYTLFGMYPQTGTLGNGRIHITAEMKKPDAPSNIKVSEKTDTSFTLTWSEPDNVTTYDIRYKASTAKNWTTVENIKDNKATISKLKAATKYSYCVRSKEGDIAGEWSKAATVTTTDPKNVKIAAPTISSSKLNVTVTWKAVTNATGYNFKYSTDNKNWKTVSVTGTSYSLPVTAGKTYYYAVQGKNSAKTGTWSATKSIKVG